LPVAEKIKIITISDSHIGDQNANIDALKKQIKYIKENDNVYCIINGDILNVALKNSKSDIYNDNMTPRQQLDFALELLEPIKEKILLIKPGNHEFRIDKETSLSVLQFLAAELGLKDRYINTVATLFLKFKKPISTCNRYLTYSIAVNHQFGGGGKTVGAKANTLQKFSEVFPADFCILSHTHQGIIFPTTAYMIDNNHCTVTAKKVLCINTGSTLNYDGYSVNGGYKPSWMSTPVIVIGGTKFYTNARESI
jgi:predicted phosphodiesterase